MGTWYVYCIAVEGALIFAGKHCVVQFCRASREESKTRLNSFFTLQVDGGPPRNGDPHHTVPAVYLLDKPIPVASPSSVTHTMETKVGHHTGDPKHCAAQEDHVTSASEESTLKAGRATITACLNMESGDMNIDVLVSLVVELTV